MEQSEAILNLLDFCWFEQEIFGNKVHTALSQSTPDQDQEIAEQPSGSTTTEIARVPSILLRSMSDKLSLQASFPLDSPSPNSVLRSPAHLHPTESGKDISKEEVLSSLVIRGAGTAANPQQNNGKDDGRRRGRRRKKKSLSKSLLELEFEELKGFMDLGFVFTEEDGDSSLASILPGLLRFGKKGKEEKEQDEKSQGETDRKFQESDQKVSPSSISSSYLSETWERLDRGRKVEMPFVNWNFPALTNEIDMKDSLRWWAHTVASTVR